LADELIVCGANQTVEDFERRELHWIEIATFINQPLLIRNGTAVKKWTFYNSFFVAMTAASTIGILHNFRYIFIEFYIDSPNELMSSLFIS